MPKPKVAAPFRVLYETRNATRSSGRNKPSTHLKCGEEKEGQLHTHIRERSTSAIRNSRSCPSGRASHSVASLINVKDGPSAGRPAAVASFSTCGGQPESDTYPEW